MSESVISVQCKLQTLCLTADQQEGKLPARYNGQLISRGFRQSSRSHGCSASKLCQQRRHSKSDFCRQITARHRRRLSAEREQHQNNINRQAASLVHIGISSAQRLFSLIPATDLQSCRSKPSSCKQQQHPKKPKMHMSKGCKDCCMPVKQQKKMWTL